MQEAQGEPLTASEARAQGMEPLRLGDPSEPVLIVRPSPLPEQVDFVTANRTVRLGDLGLQLLSDWLIGYLAKPYDRESIELWTASGIAQEEGVSRRTVYQWIEREDFPEPFAHPVGGAAVWEASRVRAWVLTSRPPMGRRPKAIRR